MGDRFADDVVMVTGGGGLIGSGIVAAFLEEGARVVSFDRQRLPSEGGRYSEIPAETFETERLLSVSGDLRSDEDIESAFTQAEHRFGPVKVLVNNAAVYGRTPFDELEREALTRVFDVNVFALMLCARRAARSMIAYGLEGRIVNLTSTSSQQSDPYSVGYDASKGAVDAATRSLAVALGEHGITVNAVGPGEMIKSQEIDNLRPPEKLSSFERRRIPIGRVATPQEVAAAVLFLASDAGRGISGSIVWVDGGTLGTWTTTAADD